MLRNLTFLAALVIVAFHIFNLVWPIIDAERELDTGVYRGIEIGNSKAETLSVIRSPFSHLRLALYYVEERGYVSPSLRIPEEPLSNSNKWVLEYPGIHKETIVLTFNNDQIVSIKYRRDALAP